MQQLEPFRCGLYDQVLTLEDLAAFPFDQHANSFAHAPPRSAQHLQAVYSGHEHSNAVVANDANALGKAIKAFNFKAGEINALELLGRTHGELLICRLRYIL